MLKVLIADDDEIFINEFLKPNIRTFLKLPLEADLEVTTASNGEDAFEKYKKNEPHVMITDYEMPKMNGKELLSK